MRSARVLPLVALFAGACMPAMAQTDSLRVLDGLEVQYRKPPQGVARQADGSLRLSTSALASGIHTLGEADAMRVATMMPGLSTMSDYASGLMIDGGDYTQTAYTLDGARVFFPYHFGGIFSDFNSQHVSAVQVGSRHHASPLAAVGVVSAITSDVLPEAPGLSANVGLLASSVTLRSPLWRGGGVRTSARLAYINWLYGARMSGADGDSRYGFDDLNLTVVQGIGQKSTLKLSAFHNADRLDYGASQGGMDARLRWHNTVATMGYTYRADGWLTTHSIDYSGMASSLRLGFPQMGFCLSASVSSFTARGLLTYSRSNNTLQPGSSSTGFQPVSPTVSSDTALQPVSPTDSNNFELSYRAEFTRFTPQTADIYGGVDLGASNPVPDMCSRLFALGASRRWRLDGLSDLRFALSGAVYVSGAYHAGSIDPTLSYTRDLSSGRLTLAASAATQYMHHLGLSDIGCASNYFLPATSALPAQRTYGVEALYSLDLEPGGAGNRPVSDRGGGHWRIDTKLFYRLVRNAPEYSGSVLDLIADTYDPLASAIEARGYNVGGNITVTYDFGVLSGWTGADMAACRRRFAGMAGWHPSANEPTWSAKSLMQWRVGRRCEITAYFTVAAGRRYTAPEAIYVLAGNILTEYGAPNDAHLPVYQRLDLSLTWRLPVVRLSGRDFESLFNLTVLNAYGHRNIEMQYFAYDQQTNQIHLHQVCSLYRFLPSLSYSLCF